VTVLPVFNLSRTFIILLRSETPNDENGNCYNEGKAKTIAMLQPGKRIRRPCISFKRFPHPESSELKPMLFPMIIVSVEVSFYHALKNTSIDFLVSFRIFWK
jgi:hypothetical protein